MIKARKFPWDEKGKMTNVVVYKKQKSSDKHYMIVTDIHLDVINNNRATKPIIDHKYDIVCMGVGRNYVDSWSALYKIKNPQIITK
jgi:hypothetical protein